MHAVFVFAGRFDPLFLGRRPAIVGGARQGVGPIGFGDGGAQFVGDLQFLFGQDGPFAGQLQLGVANLGVADAVADRLAVLQAQHRKVRMRRRRQIAVGVVQADWLDCGPSRSLP